MDEIITSSGVSLDLEQGIPIPLNLSIADFREPDKRQRNFSKEIDLPGTAANRSFFASAFNLTQIGGTYDFNSSAKVNCVYYKNGQAVLRNAVIKLNKVVITDGIPRFKVGLFSDFVDIFLLLSDVDIRDLDWSTYNHTLTPANIQASWGAPIGTGYYYPLIERNQRPGIAKWAVTDMVPYVYLVDVFRKCMEYAGQKYTSNFLNTTRVKSILFGYGGGNYVDAAISTVEQNNRKVLTNNGVLNISVPITVGTGIFTGIFTGITNYPPIPFASKLTLNEVQDIYGQLTGTKFTASRTGAFRLGIIGQFRFRYVTTVITYLSGGSRVLNYFKNGIAYPIVTLEQNSADQTFTLNTSVNIDVQQGDEIELGFSETSTSFQFTGVQSTIDLQITTPGPLQIDYTSLDTALIEGSLVEMNRFLPSMKAGEFVLGVIRMFKLMVSDNDIYGVARIEPEVSYYQGTNTTTDITEEVDLSKEIEIIPSANEFAKTLSYEYRSGTETDFKNYTLKWGETYGNYKFDQPSFFAKGEQKIELPFGTIMPYQLTPKIIAPRFVDIDNAGVKKATSGVPRVMFRNGMKTGSWQLVGIGTDSFSTYPSVHHFDNYQSPTFDLNWKLVQEVYYATNTVTSVNLFSEYYARIVGEIISKEGKLVRLYRKLTNAQVANLDWSKLLMWNGAVFRFNKIMDFDSEVTQVTKIEMIKVLEAKTFNRDAFVFGTIKLSGNYVKRTGFKNNVGVGGVKIKGGVQNQVLEFSKVIRG